MCTVVTHPSTPTEVIVRLRIQAGIVVAWRGVVVTLARAAVVRLYLISSSKRFIIEERRAALALLERKHLHTSSTSTFINYLHMWPQGSMMKSPETNNTIFPQAQARKQLIYYKGLWQKKTKTIYHDISKLLINGFLFCYFMSFCKHSQQITENARGN